MSQFYFLQKNELQNLLTLLSNKGYQCVGPQERDSSIIYAPISDVQQLPWGIADEQSLGEYKLVQGDKQYAFSWINGVSSIKTFLFKSQETVWRVKRNDKGSLTFEPEVLVESIALIGVRPCDIAAMLIQDKVFLEGELIDKRYLARRKALFTVVMNCTKASNNCFCVAAGYSPEAKTGFDLAMTELKEGFVVTTGSPMGTEILHHLELPRATREQIDQSQKGTKNAANMQTRSIPNAQHLANQAPCNQDNSYLEKISEQCISCGSCTQVCPTCFCHRTLELPLMESDGSEHIRSWDSCFTNEHGYTHGENFRQGTLEHYRQWINHKFIYWHQQFGSSGCVGCGRCMTWCPAKIDVTKVVEGLYHE